MKDLPKITIITPSYNQGHYIEQTITSILDQGYPNLEYIIIDGGSTDNSVEVIRKYEKHLAFWISEKDRGQSHAINKGMQRAKGEIVNWLNSDDYYMPGALHHVSEQFAHPNINCYCGRSRVFSESSEKLSGGTDVYFDNLPKTIGWARIDQPETFFRKQVWDTIGLLNEDFHYVMDKEFWIRYLFAYGLGGIKKDDCVVVNFRIHEQSKTSSQQVGFNKETIDLFYSLSAKLSNGAHQPFDLFKPALKDLKGYHIPDDGLIENSVNYFFLYLLLEAYAKDDYRLVKKLALVVNDDLLQSNDKEELDKVLKRMKLPVFLKRLYHRLN